MKIWRISSEYNKNQFFLKDNATFARISVNKINVIGRTELLKAKAKYNAYNSEDWTKIYFDKVSGGFNVYHKEHKFSTTGGGGDAEKAVGEMLAKYNGKQVEFLPENETKSPDIQFDNKTWDIKYVEKSNENTIRKYIADAAKADNVIFYFENKEQCQILRSAIVRETGKYYKNGKINELPDIYYMKDCLLKLLWKKK